MGWTILLMQRSFIVLYWSGSKRQQLVSWYMSIFLYLLTSSFSLFVAPPMPIVAYAVWSKIVLSRTPQSVVNRYAVDTFRCQSTISTWSATIMIRSVPLRAPLRFEDKTMFLSLSNKESVSTNGS